MLALLPRPLCCTSPCGERPMSMSMSMSPTSGFPNTWAVGAVHRHVRVPRPGRERSERYVRNFPLSVLFGRLLLLLLLLLLVLALPLWPRSRVSFSFPPAGRFLSCRHATNESKLQCCCCLLTYVSRRSILLFPLDAMAGGAATAPAAGGGGGKEPVASVLVPLVDSPDAKLSPEERGKASKWVSHQAQSIVRKATLILMVRGGEGEGGKGETRGEEVGQGVDVSLHLSRGISMSCGCNSEE